MPDFRAWLNSVNFFQTQTRTLLLTILGVFSPSFALNPALITRGSSAMFMRSFTSRSRVEKAARAPKREHRRAKARMQEELDTSPPPTPARPIVTMVVGWEKRYFAAHEDVLSQSPWFHAALQEDFLLDSRNAKQLYLPDEEPEILSCVLEFLYTGDYYPRLLRGRRKHSWKLENAQDLRGTGGRGSSEPTIFHFGLGAEVLRDTVVYCAAEKYGLERLKSLSLRKQGLQSGIAIDVILRSARYAYDHTPDTEYRLRSHYLEMIIKTRQLFARSGTMQMEMEAGGALFFDLFVSMCNYMDDLVELSNGRAPRYAI